MLNPIEKFCTWIDLSITDVYKSLQCYHVAAARVLMKEHVITQKMDWHMNVNVQIILLVRGARMVSFFERLLSPSLSSSISLDIFAALLFIYSIHLFKK